MDEQGRQEKYIFRRGGELLMSVSGKVRKGSWEFIAAAGSLLIDNGEEHLLLNQGFVDECVMVMRRDGVEDALMVLGNETKLPGLDVAKYLEHIAKRREGKNNKERILADGSVIEVWNYDGFLEGKPVTVNYESIANGTYKTINGRHLLVANSYIEAGLAERKYETPHGHIMALCLESAGIRKKIQIFLFSEEANSYQPAPDGKYKLGFMDYITVKDGRVV